MRASRRRHHREQRSSGQARSTSSASVPLHAHLLALQRSAGNAAVSRLVSASGPKPAALLEIGRAAREVPRDRLVVRVPVAQAAPGGFRAIQERAQGVALAAITGGLTQIQMSGAFRPPAWRRGARPERQDGTTVWRPTVERTEVEDVDHASLYPAAGDHDRFADSEQEIDGRTWRHVARIAPEQANQIRQGEQEHLDDAARAFQLTYQAIADAVNAVASFGLPVQPTREAALEVADAEFARRIDPALGTDPARWPGILDRLLRASKRRDEQGWHTVEFDPGRREPETGKIVWPLDTSGLQLGRGSGEVVDL